MEGNTHLHFSLFFFPQGLTRIFSFPVGDFSFSEEYVRYRHHGFPCYARNQGLFARSKLPHSNEVQTEIKLDPVKAFVLFRPVSRGKKSVLSFLRRENHARRRVSLINGCQAHTSQPVIRNGFYFDVNPFAKQLTMEKKIALLDFRIASFVTGVFVCWFCSAEHSPWVILS